MPAGSRRLGDVIWPKYGNAGYEELAGTSARLGCTGTCGDKTTRLHMWCICKVAYHDMYIVKQDFAAFSAPRFCRFSFLY